MSWKKSQSVRWCYEKKKKTPIIYNCTVNSLSAKNKKALFDVVY